MTQTVQAEERSESEAASGLTMAGLVRLLREELVAGCTPGQAAARLAGIPLARELRDELVRLGIMEVANRDLGALRGRGVEHPEEYATYMRYQHGRPHVGVAGALAMLYRGADGTEKPLALFTAADCDCLLHVFRSSARGALRRAQLLKEAKQLLARFNAATLGDLPADARREWTAAWEEVVSR
jgi:hypothetical protein